MMAFARTLLVRSSTARQCGAGGEYSSQIGRLVDELVDRCTPIMPPFSAFIPYGMGVEMGGGMAVGGENDACEGGEVPYGPQRLIVYDIRALGDVNRRVL